MAVTGEHKKVRFMHNNFLDLDHVTVSASSEQIGFEVSNLYNTSRTIKWKSDNHFEINSGNNLFYLGGVSPVIAPITSGSYNGTTLAAEIETQLNGFSSGWTVTYSTSTYLFSITHPTATIEFSKQTNSIWDTIGFTGTTDIVMNGLLDADEIRIHSVEYIDLDFGTSTFGTEFVGFIGPLAESISISANAVVKLQFDNIPISLDMTPAFEEILTHDDRGYLHFTAEAQFYRYCRILIEDRTNSVGSISMGYLYVGDYISFTSTNIARGFSKSLTDPSTIQATPSGRRYFNKRTPYNNLNNLQIQLPKRDERLTFEQFVYDHGLAEPFFISLDPQTSISNALSELTFFVNFSALPNLGHRFVDYYDIQPFSVREVV